MSTSFRRALTAVFALAFACVMAAHLTACNTVKGAGTDIQNVGQAGQNAIDGAEKK